jgi:hypothetical protein
MVAAVQHPLQLYQQKSHLCFFCICDLLVRTANTNKKDALSLFVKVKALLFSIQCGHASLPREFQPKTIPYTEKSLLVHIKTALI